MSTEGESIVTRQEAASSSYKPPHAHVPPRIDPDLYQAEIPDFKPDAEAERIALAQSARCVYSENSVDTETVDEFLVLVRNLMDKIKPHSSSLPDNEDLGALNGTTNNTVDSNAKGNESSHAVEPVSQPRGSGFGLWLKEHSNFPLQSDAATLEYLSSFDYDVEKAWFHLCCMLGCGKDAVFTRKAMTSIERQANATVFQDNKDRFFNKNLSVTSYSVAGAYGRHGQVIGRSTVNVDKHPLDLDEEGEAAPEEGGAETGVITTAVTAAAVTLRALSTKSSRSNLDALTVKSEGGAGSVDGGGSGGLFSSDEMDCIDAVGVTLSGATPVSASGGGGGRAARNTNSNLDKAELKKQWLALTRKVSALLQHAGSKKANNGASSGSRCNIREAHRLLDKAAQLTPYSTVSMSSHTVTPEEEEVLNSSKLVLGELLKAVLTTRDWIAEVRDTLYNCNLNLIIRVDRESRTVANVTELKTLLTEGCNLQITSPNEETQLRDLIATVEGISKDMRRIILVHLAANKTQTASAGGLERWGLGAGRGPERPPALYVSEGDRRKYHYDLTLAENHLKNALDYTSSATVNAAFSNGTSAGSAEELAAGRIISLAELTALMTRIRQLPIVINESIYLQHILDEALDHSHLLQSFIAKNRMLKFTKTKTILEHLKPELVTLLNLRDTIEHTCIVQIPEFAEFVIVLNVSLNWQKEVWGLNNESPPPLTLLYSSAAAAAGGDSAAATATTSSTSARAKAKAAAAAASGGGSGGGGHNKPVPLKKVEYLLTEGEKLPFTFPQEMEILKEKKQQAKLWLEKLKKSFVPSKSGSRRKDDEGLGAGGGGGGAEKLKLSDMKMMVSEGEQLFNLESSGGESGGSSGRSTVNRELDRALNVVETAEDWVNRVRELLLSDYSEAKSSDNDEESEEGIEKADKDGEEEAESDEESDSGKPPTVASMIRFLHNLLQEADQMPVVMEEATVLRAHLQALEWSVKVKPFLPVVVPAPPQPVEGGAETEGLTTTASLEETEGGAKKGARSKTAAAAAAGSVLARRKNPRPRLSEMQTFAKEITKIRGSLSEALRAEFPTKPLVEETQCLELVSEAEKWLGRVKRVVLQGNVIKKGTPLHKLRALFEEGQAIPVNFNNELKPIRGAIAAAEDWLEDHYPLLVRLGLYQEESRVRSIPREGKTKGGPEEEEDNEEDNEEGDQPMDTDEAAASAADVKQEVKEEEGAAAAETVTLKDLVDLVNSSGNLIAEFPTATALAEKLEEVTVWINAVRNITSKNVSPRESQRKKKKTSAFEESGTEEAGTAGVTAGAAVNESVTSGGKPVKLISVDELEALIDDGLSFGLDLSEEVSSLQQVKSAALNWQKKTEQYFAEEFEGEVVSISKGYTQLHSQAKSKPSQSTLGFTFLLLVEKLAATVTEETTTVNKKPAVGNGGNADKKSSAATAATTAIPSTAVVYANDREIHEMILTVLNNLGSLESEGASIGIDLPVTAVLKVHTSILNWILDARSLLCGGTVTSVNGYADSARNAQSSSANLFSTKLPHWGDCTQAYVTTLLEEAEHILNALGGESSDDAANWSHSVLTDQVLKSQKEFNDNLNDFYAEKFEDKKAASEGTVEVVEGGTAAAVGTESSGVDSHAAATTSSSGGGGKRGSRSSGSGSNNNRKRDRQAAELESAIAPAEEGVSDSEEANGAGGASRRGNKEVKVEAKATRGSQGIVKKKVDTVYDEKAAAVSAAATAASPTAAATAPVAEVVEAPAKETSSRSKKRKVDADSGVSGAIDGEAGHAGSAASSAVYVRSSDYGKHVAVVKQQGDGVHKLPSAVVSLMQLWRRALSLFSLRLAEAHRWHHEIAALVKSHTNASGVVTRYYGEQAEQFIAIATERQLHCSSRVEIEERIQGSKTWLATAAVLANGTAATKMNMEDLKAFIKLSDSVIFECDEVLEELKNTLKAARNWKVKFDRSGYDPNTGTGASSDIVTELIAESKTIGVDLSEFTENLNQFTKTYCLCRQLYFGEMVGCDTCEEWYHFSCIGVNSNIASRSDSYVCVRCALVNSFNYSCVLVANMTNKWMQCTEHFKQREAQLQRAEKKLQRDEKDIIKLFHQLRSNVQDYTRHVALQAATAAAASAAPSILGETPEKPTMPSIVIADNRDAVRTAWEALPINHKATLSPLFRELDELEVGLQKTRSEITTLQTVTREEATKLQFIVQWMMMMQKILWPQSDLQKSLGAPLGADASATAALTAAYRVAQEAKSKAASSSAAGSEGEKKGESESAEMQVEGGGDDDDEVEAANEKALASMNSTAVAAANFAASLKTGKKDPVEELSERRAFLVRSLSNNLLPDGLITMAHSAISMGIHNIEDVLLAVDAFRWMSWCNICIQLLRCPLTTYELRKLVDVTRNLRLTDEKSIKLLTNILTKACAWKSKARKLILQSMKNKLDESKLTQCVLEGNSLPFNSRLKDILKGMMSKKPTDSSSGGTASSTSGAAGGVGGADIGGTRKMKPITSYSGKSGGNVPREIPDSSDEEKTFTARQAGQAHAIAAGTAPAASFRQGCCFDPSTLADESVVKWPVTIPTPQRALNVEMTGQMMKAHGVAAAAAAAAAGGGTGSAAAASSKGSAKDDMEEEQEVEEEEQEEGEEGKEASS